MCVVGKCVNAVGFTVILLLMSKSKKCLVISGEQRTGFEFEIESLKVTVLFF